MNDPLRTRPAAAAGVWMFLGCAGGWTIVQYGFPAERIGYAIAALALAAAAVFALAKKIPGPVRLRGFFCLLGAAVMLLQLGTLQNAEPFEGYVHATVESYPLRKDGLTEVVLGEISCYDEERGAWVEVSGKARLYFPDRLGEVEAGDRLFFEAEMKLPKERRNPGGTDQRTVLWSRGISCRAILKEEQLVIGSGRGALAALLYRLRSAMEKALAEAGEEGRVLRGILFGESGALPETLLESFRQVGAAHVLAVSGLHVSALAALALWIFRRRKWLAWITAAVLVAGYGVMTGFSPSVLRATVMVLLSAWGRNHGERPDLLSMAGAAALVQMCLCPAAILGLSFQLSYGAVLGIALIGLPWSRSAGEWLKKRLAVRHPVLLRILLKLTSALTVSAGAQLGVLPASVQAFGTVPVLGALCNLIVVPLAGVALVGGLAGSIVAALFGAVPAVGAAALFPARAAVSMMTAAAKTAEGLPLANVFVGRLSVWGMMTLLLALFVVSECVEKKRARMALLSLALTAGVVLSVFAAVQRQNLTITMLDVGQGDALCIRQGGYTVLVDGGESGVYGDQGESTVVPYLRRMGIDRVDAVVVSHGDRDHCGGLLAVCEDLEVGRIYIGCERGEVEFRALKACAKEKDIPISLLKTGQSFTAGELSFQTVWPGKQQEGNDGSLVLLLRWKDFSAYLMGDAGEKVEKTLAEQGRLQQADLLKVGHHGSKYSTSEALLSCVRPEIALISAGENNPYGHPSAEAVGRLRASGATIYSTSERGAITITVRADGGRRVETVLPE